MGIKTPDGGRMSLVGHLEELRKRIFISAGSWLIAAIAAYFLTPHILPFVTKEVKNLVFLTPTEAFMVHLKVAIVGGGVLALPVILSQLILFLVPGLKLTEKRACYFIVPAAFVSFLLGAYFAIAVLLPAGLRFLVNSFATPTLTPMISFGAYVSFVLSLALAGGLVFEIPLVMAILGKIGIVKSRFLCTYRRHAVLIILLLSAVLTPTPDIFTQLLLAGPMYLLFEISIWLVRFLEPREESKKKPVNSALPTT